MVTLTRCIDMYLIGPFPRPQFFGGPRPQLLAVPRPQFSIEGCHLPFAPPRRPAEHYPDTTLRAARHDSRQSIRTPERDHQHRNPHDIEQPGIEKPNTPTGVPPRTDKTPHNDPTTPGPRDDGLPRRPRRARARASRSDDARSGATIESTSQTQSRGHSRRAVNVGKTYTGRPSGQAAETRRLATEQRLPRNRGTEPKTRIPTTPRTTTKNFIDDPTRTTHGRTESNGRISTTGTSTTKAARKAHEEPLQDRTSSETFVHSADDGNRRV